MKKILALAAAFFVMMTSAALANNAIIKTMYVVECHESITLRDAPSVYGNEIAQIPLGQAVGFIEDAGNGFFKINYDGLVGYALREYLSTERSGAAIFGTVANCRISITLRDAPYVDANEIMQIPLGERVVIYYSESTEDFYKVGYRGARGYVLKTYIRRN